MGGNVSYIGYDDGSVTRDFRNQISCWIDVARESSKDGPSYIQSCKDAAVKWQTFIESRGVQPELAGELKCELEFELNRIGEEKGISLLYYNLEAKRICAEILRSTTGFGQPPRVDRVFYDAMEFLRTKGGFSAYAGGNEAENLLQELLQLKSTSVRSIVKEISARGYYSTLYLRFLDTLVNHGTDETKSVARKAQKEAYDRSFLIPLRESKPGDSNNVVSLGSKLIRK